MAGQDVAALVAQAEAELAYSANLLRAILEDFGVEECAISARGLRHGLLREIAEGGRQ